MAGKGGDDESRGRFSGFEFAASRKRVRADRKSSLKVQLCHAMDEIIYDVKQAIDECTRDGGSAARH
ncbi:MAG TPA: hypothetical protein DCR97_12575 [Deltaproteobacteria bacterium]|nr:hypothetical protein [Deltaproteobacteria bacterium]